jgi:hypothetical protein
MVMMVILPVKDGLFWTGIYGHYYVAPVKILYKSFKIVDFQIM